MTVEEITSALFNMQDTGYKTFQAKLMPTVNPEVIIGVRTPLLRKFAKDILKTGDVSQFLDALPHRYYDENTLHGIILSELKDYDETVKRIDEFLPYVDNWATCDLMSPKVFKKHKAKLLGEIDRWILSDEVYTVRFGLEMLMSHYLDDDFKPEYLEKAAGVKNDDYYVRMMVAWFFATALAKQYASALPYIENNVLEKWTHNKSIQKAVESYRITDEQKAYLKTLKCI